MKNYALVILLLMSLMHHGLVSSFASIPGDSPYLVEAGDRIKIGNSLLEISLSRSQSGGISQILNKALGREYRSSKNVSAALWRIQLATQVDDIRWKSSGWFGNEDCSLTFETASKANLLQMQMRWVKPYVAEVYVSVAISADDPLTYWRLSVTLLDDKLAVMEVRFPYLSGMDTISGNPQSDRLLLPDGTGVLIGDPYHAFAKEGEGTWKVYPHQQSLQFATFYAENYGGVYLAANDTDGYTKQISYRMMGKESHCLMYSHFPAVSAGVQVSMPYWTILGVHSGDWREAARVYKKWATKQWWVSKGSLANRKDLIERVGSLGVLLNTRTMRNDQYSGVFSDAYRGLSLFRPPFFVSWWGWEQYDNWKWPEVFPPREGDESFKSIVRFLHSNDLKVLLSVLCMTYDIDLPNYDSAKGSRVMLADGTHPEQLQPEGLKAFMCWGATSWKDLIHSLVRRLVADFDVDCIDLDWLFVAFRGEMCFDPHHGHPIGGGNWWFKSVKNGIEEILTDLRLKKPTLCIASEEINELFIPYIDLYWDAVHVMLEHREQTSNAVSAIPVFSTIYHEFGPVGVGCNWFGAPQDYTALGHARAFVRGELLWFEPMLHASNSALAKEIADARTGFAYPYVVFGSWVDTPVVESPKKRIKFEFGYGFWGNLTIDIVVPEVLAETWKAPSGSIGIVLASLSDNKIQLNMTVDPVRLGIAGKNYALYRVDRSGRSLLERISTSTKKIVVSIPSQSVLLIEISEDTTTGLTTSTITVGSSESIRGPGLEIGRLSEIERYLIPLSVVSVTMILIAFYVRRRNPKRALPFF